MLRIFIFLFVSYGYIISLLKKAWMEAIAEGNVALDEEYKESGFFAIDIARLMK
jgi:hypothetical protein